MLYLINEQMYIFYIFIFDIIRISVNDFRNNYECSWHICYNYFMSKTEFLNNCHNPIDIS